MRCGRGLAIFLLILTLAAPALAAPNLTGTWNLTFTYITPNGTVQSPTNVVMTLTQSQANPSLYSGVLDPGGKNDLIALQQDAGSNIHFAMCRPADPNNLFDQGSSTGYVATFDGRGTASAKSFTGTFSTFWGEVGTFKGTKQQQ